MDNLWIYVLIILIFVVRGVIKGAARQREGVETESETSSDQDEGYSEWEDLFPKQEKIYTSPAPAPASPKTGTTVNSVKPVVKKTTPIPADVHEEKAKPYFSSTEDIRRGIIAAEIFNRKY
ncbi:MAG: hypothetical protein RR341_00095 [Bacteroidales bacterium]